MAAFDRRIHTKKQVGGRQVKNAERVRLQDLCQIQDSAKANCIRWDVNPEDSVARFARGNEMTDRADSADARQQRRHLVKRPVLAELLKASQLRDMKPRV